MQDVWLLLAKGCHQEFSTEKEEGLFSLNFLVLKNRPGIQAFFFFLEPPASKCFPVKGHLYAHLAQIVSALDPGDWMVYFDWQYAYFHVPTLWTHRRYLQIKVGQEHFQFVVLLFDLTSVC